MSATRPVSVIVPVYNDEKGISNVIKNLKQQTISNFEVFIVDDGSTDDTSNVIKKEIKDDTRFNYIYQMNSGVSAARNNALTRITGDFVTFVDSDDGISIDYLEVLLSIFDKDDYILGVGKIYSQGDTSSILEEYSGNEMRILLYKVFKGYVWNKIFITRVITENNLRFDTSLSVGEDLKFVFEYVSLNSDNGKLRYVDKEIYDYKEHTGSLSSSNIKNFYKSLSMASYSLLGLIDKEQELRQLVLTNFLYFYYKQSVLNNEEAFLISKENIKKYNKECQKITLKINFWKFRSCVNNFFK
ncbi:Putative glycosyltransferase, polysaccharide biosynthesis [Latilactobacillus curvatus]|uniref:glycosyltransferase n=1 Tax=Latilactobacillus curvatus TaxID=28038 RepID=UPI000A1AFF70|nr:glycosyltransferase [Latilactobacillus curvatus]SMH69115.1 Putative glycosyltransferase, polysaccharide biosynthesis [Latilactobacillus curvatus]